MFLRKLWHLPSERVDQLILASQYNYKEGRDSDEDKTLGRWTAPQNKVKHLNLSPVKPTADAKTGYNS